MQLTPEQLYALNDSLNDWASENSIGDTDDFFYERLDKATHAAAEILTGEPQ